MATSLKVGFSSLFYQYFTLPISIAFQVVKKDPQQHLHQGSSSVWSLLSVPSVPELSAAVFCLKFVRYCMYMWLPLYFVEFLGYSKALVMDINHSYPILILIRVFSPSGWGVLPGL